MIAARRWTSRSHFPTIWFHIAKNDSVSSNVHFNETKKETSSKWFVHRHRLYFMCCSSRRASRFCLAKNEVTQSAGRNEGRHVGRVATTPRRYANKHPQLTYARTRVSPPLLVCTPRRDASSISSLSALLSARTCAGQYRSNRSRRETARRLDHPPTSAISFSLFRNFRLVSLLVLNG